MVVAGVIVVTKILLNAVRPRNALEALAVMVIADAVCAGGVAWLTDQGYLAWRVRDDDGQLVPLVS